MQSFPLPNPSNSPAPPSSTGMSQAPIELCDTVFTREIMTDPVLAADGFTYNRPEITLWLDSNNTSPHTHQPLDNKTLLPNMYASSSSTSTSSSAAAAAPQIQKFEATSAHISSFRRNINLSFLNITNAAMNNGYDTGPCGRKSTHGVP